ncbi:hypothetical protein [Psychromonas arctica]|uniref:hypothetical protein n=1 Tax=Psychromonas arctica TaxID=168275 RepID=UPI000400A6B6|nr:hypothetical protein [Psychromonas arctica]
MSANNNMPFEGTEKAHKALKETLTRTTLNALLANRIPVSIADKLSRQVADKVDLLTLYKIVADDMKHQRVPKQRILDRTIVHMFEILFRIINANKGNESAVKQKEFFTLVPRGECLDLFLQLVKEYCMGDTEIQRYTYQLEHLIEGVSNEYIINWDKLYQSQEFKRYLSALLSLILKHLRDDRAPIPALENKMPTHFQPYRINSFLNQICKLKQTGALQLD